MKYTTILTGNGVGRAINSNYFPLEAGIQEIWNNDEYLTIERRQQILHCLPDLEDGNRPQLPSEEDQLATLQKVVTACDLIREVENENPIWLTELGRDFPKVIDYFIARVANYFHLHTINNPKYEPFVDGLANFIKNHYSHVATLNYDNLLYQPLIDRKVLAGYNGHLLDGFTSLKFDESNLVRHRQELGWYLHLHGSPLFYNDGNSIRKFKQTKLQESFDPAYILRRHIVLSHTKLKPEVISGSELLTTYWDYFGQALSETKLLIAVGYGGADTHINKKISDWVIRRKKLNLPINILVVEYKDGKRDDTRQSYWRRCFDQKNLLKAKEFELRRLPDILDFDWANI